MGRRLQPRSWRPPHSSKGGCLHEGGTKAVARRRRRHLTAAGMPPAQSAPLPFGKNFFGGRLVEKRLSAVDAGWEPQSRLGAVDWGRERRRRPLSIRRDFLLRAEQELCKVLGRRRQRLPPFDFASWAPSIGGGSVDGAPFQSDGIFYWARSRSSARFSGVADKISSGTL